MDKWLINQQIIHFHYPLSIKIIFPLFPFCGRRQTEPAKLSDDIRR